MLNTFSLELTAILLDAAVLKFLKGITEYSIINSYMMSISI